MEDRGVYAPLEEAKDGMTYIDKRWWGKQAHIFLMCYMHTALDKLEVLGDDSIDVCKYPTFKIMAERVMKVKNKRCASNV